MFLSTKDRFSANDVVQNIKNPEKVLIKVFFINLYVNKAKVIYSQTCVQRPHLGPKKAAVVDRWSLFKGHLCSKSLNRDLQKVVVIDRWSLFGGGC